MSLVHHIERARQQPHHVRKNLALIIAAIITGIIALLWLGIGVASGSFAINAKPIGSGEASSGSPATQTNQGLAGVAAGAGGANSAPSLEVVSQDTSSDASTAAPPAKTVIPF